MPDFSRYLPPGVYSDAVPGPQVGLQATTPSAVAIFGAANGYQTDTHTLVVPSDDDPSGNATPTAPLRQRGVDTSTLVVRNLATGVVYQKQTTVSPPDGDYFLVATAGPSGSQNGPDTTYTLKRVVDSGSLAEGTTLQVTYQYTDSSYFTPQTFYDYDDVTDKYGAPFNSDGSINSELSLAARLALINGASAVVCAPVSNLNSPQVSDYTTALDSFSGYPGISVVVCANGNPNIFPSVKSHVESQSGVKFERRAILGVDGTASAVTSETLQSAARTLKSARIALVSPATVNYFNTALSQEVAIGGQYMAAALAGWSVSHSPENPLTRKAIAGFSSIAHVADAKKNNETQAGLLVVETGLRVRHGVTTDPSTLVNREWSILGQQDSMAYRLRTYFDSDGLIGGVIRDETAASIKGSAQAALESLTSDGTILAYSDLKVRTSPSYPDVIEIGFTWRPSVPANYIVVRFTLDVSSGETTINTAIAA